MDEQRVNLKTTELGGRDKGFLLQIREEGVYLCVFSDDEEQFHFKAGEIIALLAGEGIKEYDENLIVKAIGDKSEKFVKVAESAMVQVDPIIDIKVSKNRMEAVLSVEMPDNARSLTEGFIREKLQAAGIQFGVSEEAMKELVNLTSHEVVIAEGLPPQNGENARIVQYFDLEKCGRPEEAEHGRVDFKNLNLFVMVKPGDLLAERIPHTMGTAGMDVFGGVIAAKPGKPVMLPLGKNTKLVEDNKIVSEIEGQVILVNNKISVDPRLEIKGDVDLSTGNIDFAGSVFIKGSVQPGFIVKAGGDVEIMGNISGGTVMGRNITVKAGIQGMQRGEIIAEQDIKTSFAENAKISAGRDLYVSEAVLHSSVSAGKKIIVNGRRGIIAGGSAIAGNEITVKTAGNQMDTSTKLEVGISPQLREELKKTKKLLTEAQDSLDQAQKAVKVLKSIPIENLSLEKRETLLKLTKAQFPLAGEVKKYQDRLEDIENQFLMMKDGKVKILEFAYPGVKIIIGSIIKNIRSKEQHCTFFAENGEIRVGLL